MKECEYCGGVISGKGNPVYDENWNKQKGLVQCDACAYAYGDKGLSDEQKTKVGIQVEKKTDMCVCIRGAVEGAILSDMYKVFNVGK